MLAMSVCGCLAWAQVLAVFPDTTSFYRAIITKLPKRLAPGPQEVHCKFDVRTASNNQGLHCH
jgi:hypothetical protein